MRQLPRIVLLLVLAWWTGCHVVAGLDGLTTGDEDVGVGGNTPTVVQSGGGM